MEQVNIGSHTTVSIAFCVILPVWIWPKQQSLVYSALREDSTPLPWLPMVTWLPGTDGVKRYYCFFSSRMVISGTHEISNRVIFGMLLSHGYMSSNSIMLFIKSTYQLLCAVFLGGMFLVKRNLSEAGKKTARLSSKKKKRRHHSFEGSYIYR